jgi:FAD/FMN-containing dehydrogenase
MASTLETLLLGLNKRDIRTVSRDSRNRGVFRDALFNGRLEPGGLALANCKNEADVQAVVRLAADTGIPLAVLAGGHDTWARAFADDNLILDLRQLSQVHTDPTASEVTIGGGVLTRNLLAALPDDTVTVTGSCLSVGMTGLALGGGYGTLTPRFGLAADCIRRARVVLADGSIAIASEKEDADLLWALQGGGSGFGVVTSLTLAVHRLPKVLKGVLTSTYQRHNPYRTATTNTQAA